MTRIQDLQAQIDELRARLDLLSGRPRGPITYQEAERDLRAGNKRTMERFVMQLGEGGGERQRLSGAGRETVTQPE
jgi:hypothetical protein